MWQYRLNAILSSNFEMISLDPNSTKGFCGRYLKLDQSILALGREIAVGAEARVYELVDLRSAVLVGVTKICLFPPGSDEYRQWAVPYRFEGNKHSDLQEVELQPSMLLPVAGGIIKVQKYVSKEPATDWAMTDPADPILASFKEKPEKAIEKANELMASYGAHGIYLEYQGRIHADQNDLKAAEAVFEQAIKTYRTESRAGFLRTGTALARIYKLLFANDGQEPMSIDLGNGLIHKQIIFSNPEDAAIDDTLEDKSMYVLFEILDIEPYYIPALMMLADEFYGGFYMQNIPRILDKIDEADPGREDVKEYRDVFKKNFGSAINEPTSVVIPKSQPPTIPSDFNEYNKRFDTFYQPEPKIAQTYEARLSSALANLKQGRIEDAQRAAREAILLAPKKTGGYVMLAKIMSENGQEEKSFEVLQKASKEIESPEIYQELGFSYIKLGKPELAVPEFLRALVSAPAEQWQIELGLGIAYEMQKQCDKAIPFLRKAYAVMPNGPGVALQLAQALFQNTLKTTQDLLEAIDILDGALVSSPDDENLLICKSQVCYILGRLKSTISLLEKVAANNPNHPFAQQILDQIKKENIN